MEGHNYQSYQSLGESLDNLTRLTEENNRMLKAIRRDRFVGLIITLIVWGVILYGTYYFTLEYVGPLIEQFNQETGYSIDFGELIRQYQAQMAP